MIKKLVFTLFLLTSFYTLFAQYNWNYEVQFESGQWKVQNNELLTLLDELECLKKKQIVEIEISSSADTVGTLKDNQLLSELRLEFILSQFSENLDTSDIKIIKNSKGEQSIQPNLALNRAVIINIKTQNIEYKAGIDLVTNQYFPYRNKVYSFQKDSTACNDYLRIFDKIDSVNYQSFPSNPKNSTAYTIYINQFDSQYVCLGHVLFFKNGNYSLEDSIGWFDKSVLISGFCSGILIDSLDFSKNKFTVRYDEIDNGYYIFLPFCPQRPQCCGGSNGCSSALLLPEVFQKNQTTTIFKYLNKKYDSIKNDTIIESIRRVKTNTDKVSLTLDCEIDSVIIFAKWDSCFWYFASSFESQLEFTNTKEELLDSLAKISIYSMQTKYTTPGKRAFVPIENFKPVYFSDNKIIIKNKDAVEAGIFLPEFHAFIPYKKMWFNRFVGYEIEDLKYSVVIKRGKILFHIEDYEVKVRHRKRKSIYKFKKPKTLIK